MGQSNANISNYNRKIRFALNFIITKIPLVPKLLLKYKPNLIKKVFVDSIIGEINLEEAIFLEKIARNIDKPGLIIEIGTLFGKSTMVIASNKPPECELITIDNYSWNPFGLPSVIHYQITQHFLYDAINKYNVKVFNIDKEDFYAQFSDTTPSLVFLDAIHTYSETKKDILWAKRINARLICGHDYDQVKHPEVVKAVNEFGGPKELVKSLWVI